MLLVAADVRAQAPSSSQTLGEQIDVPVFDPGGLPVEDLPWAMGEARKLKCDTIIYDTAGRLAVDEPLMKELKEIKGRTKAENIYLVVDAMIGQDAVKTAAAFNDRLSLTGVVLTKLDGDARGGAALSIKQVTGAAVRYVGTGETVDRLEEFRPEGMASRILGMGDIVGLMKDFEDVVDEQKAEEDAKRMLQGRFTLHDFLEQIRTLQQMGPLQDLFEKLPFFQDSVPEGFNVDEGELKRAEAIVSSMTKQERREPDLFKKEASRVTRVAKGCGREPKDVVDLLNRFMFMRQMMGNIGQQAGLLQKLPGMKQAAMARQLNQMVKTGGLEGNPMMAGLADQLLEAAVAEGPGGMFGALGRGAPSVGKRKAPTKAKRKDKRKKQKQARRKSRK
ncbi:MAG: signal recognition particle protein [Sandaracinaceae bacterium]